MTTTAHILRKALLAATLATLLLAAPSQAATLAPGSTAILSGTNSLFGGLTAPVDDSESSSEAVSADGRFVAFASTSDGLLAGDDDRVQNIYVKDRSNGAVTLVSRRTGANGEPSHESCEDPAISDDGSRVGFTCTGPLDNADTNDFGDVYVRALGAETTTMISRVGNTGPAGDSSSSEPSLSADGSVVAFSSAARNLTSAASDGRNYVLYRKTTAGQGISTDVASRRSQANGNGVVEGYQPSVSDDGNVIAFTDPDQGGDPTDPADTNDQPDVYVRNVTAANTVLASRKDGQGAVGNGPSTSPALAGNASAVAFQSESTQFDSQADPDTQPDVYRRSLTSGTTALVDINNNGAKAQLAGAPSIDRSGAVVGFLAQGGSLDPDDGNEEADAYIRNVDTSVLKVVSRADGPSGAVSNAGAEIAVSGDGRKAAVSLQNGRVIAGADARKRAVILRDNVTDRTDNVAQPAGTAPFRNEGGRVQGPSSLSADGRFAAFVSDARGLGLPDDAARAAFVRDRVTGRVTLVSRQDGANGAAMGGGVNSAAISADGRRVAFELANKPGGQQATESQIWVRDIPSGRSFLASRADGANGATGNGYSELPALDADGSRVAFTTTASNLGDGDTDGVSDIHVRDLAANRTLLASRANGAAGPKGDRGSFGPDIDASGQRVLLQTRATNLGDGDTDDRTDAHVRDLGAGTTRLASAAPGGQKSNADVFSASIDASGTRVAFAAGATNLLGVPGAFEKVFVRDLARNTLVLASRANGAAGAPANAASNDVRISPDGGSVAFASSARNLAAGVPAGSEQVYLRDLTGGRTELMSRRSGTGAPFGGSAQLADISLGGGCVTFQSPESLYGSQRGLTQLYMRAVRQDCAPGGAGGAGAGGAGGGAVGAARDTARPVLSRVRLSRRSIRARRGRTTLSFRSSERARLSIRFDRVRRGRRARRAASLTKRIRAGRGRIRISSRIGRKRLARGSYRLTLVARDAAGNRSRAKRLTLRVR